MIITMNIGLNLNNQLKYIAMLNSNEKKAMELKVDIPQEKLEALYSNSILMQTSPYDFIFNFGQQIGNALKVNSRIAMSPQHAKSFLKILKDNLDQYERAFGEINLIPQIVKNPDEEKPQTYYPQN